MNEYDLDRLTIEEIYKLIENGTIDPNYPKEYYNNEWWDEIPFSKKEEI